MSWLRRQDPYVLMVGGGLVVLLAALSLLSPHFLTTRNLLNVLQQVSVLAIVATGMTFVVISGGFDLSVGSTVALAGSVAAVVMVRAGLPAGVLAGLAVGLAIGMANGYLVSRVRISPFLATLSSLVIGRGLALGATGGAAVFGLPRSFHWLGTGQVLGVPVPVYVAALVALGAAYLLHAHAFGLQVFAVGGNREAARLAGIPVDRVVLLAYTLCGALAGLAGLVLTARIRAGEPTVGIFMELFAIAGVVLGGTSLHGGEGSIGRSILGVLWIGFLENGLNLMNVPYYWQQVIIGLVFIAAASLVMIRRWR